MPVILSLKVAPACVAPASTDPDQYVDQTAVVMGWGPSGNEKSPNMSLVFYIYFICHLIHYLFIDS